jgi:outer membrane protein OmpA-like peptidoglycan-associated protein
MPTRRKPDLPLKAAVYFSAGSPALDQAALATLDKIALELKEADPLSLRIVIAGYTDNIGSLGPNKKLAEERAQAVADYFHEKGIVPKEIVTGGRPLCCYVASNDTEEGRGKNRRAKIWVESAQEIKRGKPN